MRKIRNNLIYIWNLITKRYLLITYIIILSIKSKWYKNYEKAIKNIKSKNNFNESYKYIHINTYIHENEHELDHMQEKNIILNKEYEKRPQGRYKLSQGSLYVKMKKNKKTHIIAIQLLEKINQKN